MAENTVRQAVVGVLRSGNAAAAAAAVAAAADLCVRRRSLQEDGRALVFGARDGRELIGGELAPAVIELVFGALVRSGEHDGKGVALCLRQLVRLRGVSRLWMDAIDFRLTGVRGMPLMRNVCMYMHLRPELLEYTSTPLSAAWRYATYNCYGGVRFVGGTPEELGPADFEELTSYPPDFACPGLTLPPMASALMSRWRTSSDLCPFVADGAIIQPFCELAGREGTRCGFLKSDAANGCVVTMVNIPQSLFPMYVDARAVDIGSSFWICLHFVKHHFDGSATTKLFINPFSRRIASLNLAWGDTSQDVEIALVEDNFDHLTVRTPRRTFSTFVWQNVQLTGRPIDGYEAPPADDWEGVVAYPSFTYGGVHFADGHEAGLQAVHPHRPDWDECHLQVVRHHGGRVDRLACYELLCTEAAESAEPEDLEMDHSNTTLRRGRAGLLHVRFSARFRRAQGGAEGDGGDGGDWNSATLDAGIHVASGAILWQRGSGHVRLEPADYWADGAGEGCG